MIEYFINLEDDVDYYLNIANQNNFNNAIILIKFKKIKIKFSKKILLRFWYNYVIPHLANKLMKKSLEEYN
jgi:hypothetical protein